MAVDWIAKRIRTFRRDWFGASRFDAVGLGICVKMACATSLKKPAVSNQCG